MTVYIYLNDVEEGGGTRFPRLGLTGKSRLLFFANKVNDFGLKDHLSTVTPKRGRVVLWPSVLDEDPDKKDPRTIHEAMKVIKGVKYGYVLLGT
jgi:prolyl 4-hydroxylase